MINSTVCENVAINPIPMTAKAAWRAGAMAAAMAAASSVSKTNSSPKWE
jgi:hypothetical protein